MRSLRGFGANDLAVGRRLSVVARLCPVFLISLAISLLLVCGCDRASPAPVVTTNVVEVVREVVVTNAVTVTNVVCERREPNRALTVRKTAPYVISSAVLTHRQLRDALTAGSARVLSLERSAVVEANERILSKIAESCAGTVSVRPLGAAAKVCRGAETGGRVVVRPVSSLDRVAVTEAVTKAGGTVVSELPASGSVALVCKLSGKAVLEMAARPDVWLIERYGK